MKNAVLMKIFELPAGIVREAGSILVWLPVGYMSDKLRQTVIHTHIHTCNYLHSPINLTACS